MERSIKKKKKKKIHNGAARSHLYFCTRVLPLPHRFRTATAPLPHRMYWSRCCVCNYFPAYSKMHAHWVFRRQSGSGMSTSGKTQKVSDVNWSVLLVRLNVYCIPLLESRSLSLLFVLVLLRLNRWHKSVFYPLQMYSPWRHKNMTSSGAETRVPLVKME